MSTREHQLTDIYCFIDDYLKAHPHRAQWRRSPDQQPAFTAAEVSIIALWQGSFGCATLKGAIHKVSSQVCILSEEAS